MFNTEGCNGEVMADYVPLVEFDYSWVEEDDALEKLDELDDILLVEDNVDKIIEEYNAKR